MSKQEEVAKLKIGDVICLVAEDGSKGKLVSVVECEESSFGVGFYKDGKLIPIELENLKIE